MGTTTTPSPIHVFPRTTPFVHANVEPAFRHHPPATHHIASYEEPYDYDYNDGSSYYNKEDSLASLRTYIQGLLDRHGLDKSHHGKSHHHYTQPKYHHKVDYKGRPIGITPKYHVQKPYPTTTIKSYIKDDYPPHVQITHVHTPKPYP